MNQAYTQSQQEATLMLNRIKKLLQDMQLRQRIRAAQTLDDTTQIMASRDAKITSDDVLSLLHQPGFTLAELDEADLLSVAGGRLTTKCSSGCPDTE
ncbi:MAG: hypothetical protein AAFW84_04005 [Cyanobacteria bacterium J06635_15]